MLPTILMIFAFQAMEPYPPDKGIALVGEDSEGNYEAAKTYIKKLKNEDSDSLSRNSTMRPELEPVFILEDKDKKDVRLGTLSKEEWDAITLYCVFAFKKRRETQ